MRWRPSARTSLAPCARMCSRHAHTFVVELAGAWLDVDRRQVHRLRSRHNSKHHRSKPTPRHPANQTQALSLVCVWLCCGFAQARMDIAPSMRALDLTALQCSQPRCRRPSLLHCASPQSCCSLGCSSSQARSAQSTPA